MMRQILLFTVVFLTNQGNTIEISMLSEPVILLVLLCGVIVTGIVLCGLYLGRKEMREEFERQREQKLSYRTNEEFIG
jgi:uncharacterized protein (DUF2062 family)